MTLQGQTVLLLNSNSNYNRMGKSTIKLQIERNSTELANVFNVYM